jgi:hypothetical protein
MRNRQRNCFQKIKGNLSGTEGSHLSRSNKERRLNMRDMVYKHWEYRTQTEVMTNEDHLGDLYVEPRTDIVCVLFC